MSVPLSRRFNRSHSLSVRIDPGPPLAIAGLHHENKVPHPVSGTLLVDPGPRMLKITAIHATPGGFGLQTLLLHTLAEDAFQREIPLLAVAAQPGEAHRRFWLDHGFVPSLDAWERGRALATGTRLDTEQLLEDLWTGPLIARPEDILQRTRSERGQWR